MKFTLASDTHSPSPEVKLEQWMSCIQLLLDTRQFIMASELIAPYKPTVVSRQWFQILVRDCPEGIYDIIPMLREAFLEAGWDDVCFTNIDGTNYENTGAPVYNGPMLNLTNSMLAQMNLCHQATIPSWANSVTPGDFRGKFGGTQTFNPPLAPHPMVSAMTDKSLIVINLGRRLQSSFPGNLQNPRY